LLFASLALVHPIPYFPSAFQLASTNPVEPILRTTNLGKRFRNRWAAHNINLEIQRGDIFGLLGPNGAGKSTTMRMILSLINPTEGGVEIFGKSLKHDRGKALESVGGIVEKPDFYLYLSAITNLEIAGSLSGGVTRKRVEEVIDLVGLLGRARDKVKTYSHGMKQRLGIAQALLTNPELVILDEPTNGLDPQGMKEVRDLVVRLAKDQKKAVILSSHLLNEVEMVANRMAVLNKGELIVQGGVQHLLDEGEMYIILRAEPRKTVSNILRQMKESVVRFKDAGDGFAVTMDFDKVPDLARKLVSSGVRIRAIIPRRSLEDFFLSVTESNAES